MEINIIFLDLLLSSWSPEVCIDVYCAKRMLFYLVTTEFFFYMFRMFYKVYFNHRATKCVYEDSLAERNLIYFFTAATRGEGNSLDFYECLLDVFYSIASCFYFVFVMKINICLKPHV